MSRKITQESINAFRFYTSYSKDNTSVIVYWTSKSPRSELRLHGNLIATNEDGTVRITTAGWNTNTTKERLRAIPGVTSLSTKKWQLYLNGKEWDGEWIAL